MQYFIAIIPPDEYKDKIMKFQQEWITIDSEPHITVKAQGGLNSDLTWLEEVKKVCKEFSPFSVSIKHPAYFGSEVLFLGAESEGVVELHRRLVQAVSPSADLIQRYFEYDQFIPHLTLGQTSWGLSQNDLSLMMSQAETLLQPYPLFEARFIRVYKEAEPNKYEPLMDIELGDY
ncbi:2'-5' RNA ligase family protein [Fictibacillus aquaticus]|uniref:2'-5' RNA ligase n=1 Tax=Fictibacillus aquaticus TaxID=2021314 RepID=A0A235FDW5_9BACL|nr:2'-5' RNA ligase family protein [Fictibacillus aquaticus]OYD59402.1 2'-5' RNA ligase [Fictibacillus aquaticus]